ncbi:carboxypeptidase-like regulatory domain-containing protein [Bacteroides thetaiotaomicron]|nr:carboxypeptidase-like regulatory domain-containing protein [Bacteroides thetaiotaomicron]
MYFFIRSGWKTISGVVMDESGLPIIGANVLEAGSQSNGTITDLDGRFQLVLSKDDASLQFSYIGYTTIEKKSMPILYFK